VVGKRGNTIKIAPSTRKTVPATKKSARPIFWLVFVSLVVSGSCCIFRRNCVTVLKYLLFTRKKPEIFAKFVKKGVIYRSNEVLIFMRRVAAESDTSLTPGIISTLFLRSLRCSRSCA